MNASRILNAILTENLLDAKHCLHGLLYNKAETILNEKTIEITEETFNEACTDCNEDDKDGDEYQKFFQSALKKFGVTAPDQLKGDKKKEFYNYVDKNWKSDAEKDTGEEDPKESVEVDERHAPLPKSSEFVVHYPMKDNKQVTKLTKLGGKVDRVNKRVVFKFDTAAARTAFRKKNKSVLATITDQKEGTETDIAKEKENIAKAQERIRDLNDRAKRQRRAERGT